MKEAKTTLVPWNFSVIALLFEWVDHNIKSEDQLSVLDRLPRVGQMPDRAPDRLVSSDRQPAKFSWDN